MSKNSYEQIFIELTGKGWLMGNINPNAVTDAPICSFYCFMPLQHHMVAAHISIDKFYELIEYSTTEFPSHIKNTTNMINGICNHAINTSTKHSKKDEEATGLFMAMYMPMTVSGMRFLSNFPNLTFDFVVVLYPTNKKGTTYAGRPAVYPRTDAKLLNTKEALERAEGVMLHDLEAGKKEYFKYLKGWKKKHN
ncbi:MAG: hypothetical protein ACI9T7_000086 [Oleiphilaceae bacterium]|jgi:hypothetical protein